MKKQSDNLRAGIAETLALFAEPDAQRAYQRNVPYVSVPTEMFCTWGDDIYWPDSSAYCQVFDDMEMRALEEFNEAFAKASRDFAEGMPILEEYIASAQGAELARAARVALQKLAPHQ